jgi:hypothetical protein
MAFTRPETPRNGVKAWRLKKHPFSFRTCSLPADIRVDWNSSPLIVSYSFQVEKKDGAREAGRSRNVRNSSCRPIQFGFFLYFFYRLNAPAAFFPIQPAAAKCGEERAQTLKQLAELVD